MSDPNVEVIACVNHDAAAIKSHLKNYPNCKHFTEDVRDFNVIRQLSELVEEIRKKDPKAIINIWASLECTHFSKAKGGMARNADSRTLADHLKRYVTMIDPDYLYIENVREFLTWGPLDSNGKPILSKKGVDYERWRDDLIWRGYDYDYKMLNSADFGAYTSRERYFGIFARKGLPIEFPIQTHAKKGKVTGNLKPWLPVRDLLDLSDHGRSIFGKTKMGKPYSENTLTRIFSGLEKFKDKGLFLTSYYGNGQAHSVDDPCNTLTTKDRYAVHFLDYDYSSPTSTSIDDPAGTITTRPKHKLLTAQFTFDTQFGNTGRSIDEPSQTLIAKMNKKPIYLLSANRQSPKVDHSIDQPGDSYIVKKIRKFMRDNGIKDIKIRSLKVSELKDIQGFPKSYQMVGTKTNQLKFIGNSVVPLMSKLLADCNYESLRLVA